MEPDKFRGSGKVKSSPESRFMTLYLVLLFFSCSRGPPKSLVADWNRLPRRDVMLFLFKELLYALFSKRDPRVWTTPSTSGKRCVNVWGWSASPFCQSTCLYYYYMQVQNRRGIVWEERDTLDVHAGECPFAVRKGSPEVLGVEYMSQAVTLHSNAPVRRWTCPYLTLVTWIPCLSAALQTAEPNGNTIICTSCCSSRDNSHLWSHFRRQRVFDVHLYSFRYSWSKFKLTCQH